MPLRTWTCEWVAACAAVSVESGPSSRSHHLRLKAAQGRGSGRLVALQRQMTGNGSSSAAIHVGDSGRCMKEQYQQGSHHMSSHDVSSAAGGKQPPAVVTDGISSAAGVTQRKVLSAARLEETEQ